MANNRRRKTKQAAAPKTVEIIPEAQTKSDSIIKKPENDFIAKRRVLDTAKYLTKSAFETALDNVWLFFGGVILTALVTLVAYVWSGQAVWLYPYLIYAGIFLSGMFSIIILILFLTFLKLRKERAIEKAKNNKFISNTKGLLDHRADFQKAIKLFPVVLSEFAKELGRIGKTTLNNRLDFWDKISASLSRRSASRIAAKINKHSERMERYLTQLATLITSIDESTTYFFESDSIDRQHFDILRNSLKELLNKNQTSCASLSIFRDSQVSVMGISQDLNTAMNRMIFVTDGIIEELKKAEGIWKQLIEMIDKIKNETK
jgi:methyl-accepting chemotaxis protein